MTNGRRKGANFERELANMIMDELGIDGVKRELEQYRSADHGDLMGVDGWTIEAKRYAHGVIHKPEWWHQVETSADRDGNEPVLIYKYDRHPIRCVVRLSSINADYAGKDDVATVTFETWCMLVRESWA